MAAKLGKAYLLKVDIAATFTVIAGMKSVRITQGRQTIDITNADSAGQARELMTTGGVKNCSISFSGIFTDAASDAALQTDYEAGTLRDFQIVLSDYGTYEGGFIITQLDHSANFDGGGEFSITLESGDNWTFT
jgi:TP901-1 family phage major tail protein